MSGLIAFTGPPDPALAHRMLGRIAHRGKPIDCAIDYATGTNTNPRYLESPFGSIAICEWDSLPKLGLLQSGYSRCSGEEKGINVQRGSGTKWALSGFVYTDFPNHPTIDSIARLRGSFAIACLADGALTILRDPTGCQSLYYGRVGGRWLVASEPKAFTSEPEFSKRIRPAAIAQYLAFSFVPGRGTMLEDVFEAEAGHVIRLRCGEEPEIVRTFRFEDHEWCESQPRGDRDERYWIERTRQAVQQAVAERLTEQPAAVFLSGGLDSSVIAAEVARQSAHPVHTFSIHFGTKYPNELDFAKQVAERIGSRHEEVLIQPKHFLPRLRQMIWHLDEPIGDPITQPNFELASHVGKNFDAVFNGEGGDPLFGGPKNIPMMMLHWYGDVARPANFREQAYLASYRRAYEEWSRLLTDDVRLAIDPERDLEQVLVPFFNAPKPTKFLNKLMAINIRLKGANLILPKVDRMLAAHGLTPLSPLFDDRLTRLSFEMPPQMKLRSGIEKYVLKRAYEHALPASVIERPKSGMRVPVHYWFQKELRRYAASILSKKNITQAGIFDPDRICQLLRYETEEGPGRYGLRLWMLLTFEIWRRMVVDGE